MTKIFENSDNDAFIKESTSLVHLGTNNETSYLQIFNRRKRTRWDDNPRPSKYSYIKNKSIDIKTVASRKSRWGSSSEKTFTPLPYTLIPEDIDVDSFEILIRRYRLNDVNKRIQNNDFENADPDLRSPSPEPIYDSKGLRLNTRDVRTKEKYIKEKNSLIEQLILLDESYRPPADYRPPKKIKKIYINEIDNEKHKLVGLILGVGGATQRELEKKSGCRISVRGKGSNWKGNFNSDFSVYDENEPLHVHVVAETEEQIMKSCAIIDPILDPYSQEHMYYKQMQKQAIAVMYGYQTDTSCENCGEKHRTWACPLNFAEFDKVDVRCAICHDKSHPTIDCPERKKVDETEVESELTKFLREVDEFKKSADVPVLQAEIEPDDIRNSILYTGIMPEIVNRNNEDKKVIAINNKQDGLNKSEENENNLINRNNDNIDNTISISENTKSANLEFDININSKNQNNATVDLSNVNQPQQNIPVNNQINPIPQSNSNQTEYRVPIMPIVNNPNVIRSAPVSYMNSNPFFINQTFTPPAGNNYYNFLSPINGVNYFPLNPNLQNAYTKNFNLISSNFQGKIPTSYSGLNLSPLLNFPSRNRIYEYSTMNNYAYGVNSNHNQNFMRPPQNFAMGMPPNMQPTANPGIHQNLNSFVTPMNMIPHSVNINNVNNPQAPMMPNAPGMDHEIPLPPPEPEDEPNKNQIKNQEILMTNESKEFLNNNTVQYTQEQDDDIQILKIE